MKPSSQLTTTSIRLTYGLNTGVTDPRLFGFPRINPGTDAFNYMGGNSSWPLETTPSKTDSFSDTATYTHGKHSIRFGGSFRYGDVNYYRAVDGRGRVDFTRPYGFHGWQRAPLGVPLRRSRA